MNAHMRNRRPTLTPDERRSVVRLRSPQVTASLLLRHVLRFFAFVFSFTSSKQATSNEKRATRNLSWPLRLVLMLLGLIGIGCSLLLAYRGEAPGQLPWNVAGGRGTPADPYLVQTCAQLQTLSAAPMSAYALTNDIDCSDHLRQDSSRGFTPIGIAKDGFTGTLDGRGFTIRNLVLHRPSEDAVGLFSMLGSGSIVSHLTLHISVTGRDSVGGLVGWLDGGALVSDLTVTGQVKGRLSIGGAAGVSCGVIRSATGGMAVTGVKGIGGITGIADEGSRIEHVVVSGTVSGETDVGGIAGVSRGALIEDCAVSGSIEGKTDVGAIVGWLMGGMERASSIADCRFSGRLTGALKKDAMVGRRGLPK